MILDRAEIKNFRSISSLSLSFAHKCLVLVGINESGKSNIINALSTLSDDIEVLPLDKRQTLPEEDVIKEAYVRFVFKFDDNELADIESELSSKILSPSDNPTFIINSKHEELTLQNYLSLEKREILYVVNVLSKTKSTSNWKAPRKYTLNADYKAVSPQCPDTFQVILPDGSSETLKKCLLVHKDYSDKIPPDYLINSTFDEIESTINKTTKLYYDGVKPDSLYWDYSEKNLLPSQIDIIQFTANPNICIPLKQMFILSGITDIKKTIEEEKAASPHRLRNCLNRVAEITTKHFREVWKEYKDISIQLSINGSFIEASVKDDFNHYEFSSRSDGFKRFITFLLLISAKVKTNNLTNTLILIDEPDICLHPSGARYLRDELINISSKNTVVYSTHSIFMIDKDNIERHLIVKKAKEQTNVYKVTSSNIVDEEVLFNALGYSIFESLKKVNIIFEGWKDKRLCEEALKKLPKKYKQLKDKFSDIGLCHAKGVKDIQNIVPLLQLADRKCIILSDNDKAAIDRQKEFNKAKGYGTWFKYKDIDESIDAITGEDFVTTSFIVSCITELSKEHPELAGISASDISSNNKLSAIHRKLKTNDVKDEAIKALIENIKDYIFDHLKAADIEPLYFDMLVKIAEKIEAL